MDLFGFSENDIITYHDFFEKDDFSAILDYLNRPMWLWGHNSLNENDPDKPKYATPFWKMHLNEEYFFTKYLLNIIENKTDQKFHLDRCYCNGHTYGTSGLFHEDWYDDMGRTVLLYANKTWRQEWGGKTVFDLNGKYHYNEFIPNSIVMFPGVIPHRAETTTRAFLGLRKTVAWKLLLKDKR
tara:strand:+ start:54 stop:602 length:549 start_codon:yes stop_codon:yes gene_type:complete